MKKTFCHQLLLFCMPSTLQRPRASYGKPSASHTPRQVPQADLPMHRG